MTDTRNAHVAEPFRSTLNGFEDAMAKVAKPALRPIKAAHELMLTQLAALVPPYIHVVPSEDEFQSINEYLLDVANIVDQMITEVGREVKANAQSVVDLRDFEHPLRDALEGFACHSIDQEIERMREDDAEEAA